MREKSSVQEIRERFDHDVERFSNLQSGQVSTVDAALSLELITEAAARLTPLATDLLDVGCGAGNYTLKMLSKRPGLHCTLLDLSRPMLDRAVERVSACSAGRVTAVQRDVREADLGECRYDIVLSGAALHHLRGDEEWQTVFARLYRSLRPGGCLMISDLVAQQTEVLSAYFRERYGDYLTALGGTEYRDRVLAYVEREDSPRPLNYQLDLMREVGFREVEILHKNVCFAAYGGVR